MFIAKLLGKTYSNFERRMYTNTYGLMTSARYYLALANLK